MKTKKTLSVKSRLQTFKVDSCTNNTKKESTLGRTESILPNPESIPVSLHFPLLLVYTLLDDSTLRSLAVSPVSLCSSHRYTLLGGRKEEAAVALEKKKETTAVREEE
ncbi:hypothetical protein PIB30_099275 [Stylosanthes scabra]|uniref:Uncharacterized protein n=1 Tax=Stylosanthes scabra TaxID=79078 RepID=A0ABU6WWQ6_9FABA|nr:hypothetical protein [Stylosanthes scabra]